MITILASTLLSCTDAAWVIQGIRQSDLSPAMQAEMVITVIEGTDTKCDLTESLEAQSRR